MNEVILSVSDFVALTNQILENAFGSVVITGELANFKISKNKWVYFDLKDELASVRFFGTVYAMPGPLEDGMLLEVRGTPRLHPQFGFSINVQSIRPTGEGSIKKAAKMLEAKLRSEGLFDESRKRYLPHPPETIGLITSSESAAYADFMKILNARWRGIEINLIDVQVQGEAAVRQIVSAIEHFNQMPQQPDVLILIRGGGSADDLQAFSTEQVVRAVAASRVPMLVAIGHEIDISLAELAADRQASTPSNAAELLVPDRVVVKQQLREQARSLTAYIEDKIAEELSGLVLKRNLLHQTVESRFTIVRQEIIRRSELISALNPLAVLERGYAIVRDISGGVIRNGRSLQPRAELDVQFADTTVRMNVK